MDTFSAVKFFGALFAIMNPISNLPVFLSAIDGATASQRRMIAAPCCLLSRGPRPTCRFGKHRFDFSGISVNDFRVAGGLVVLLIGLHMLNGKDSTAHHGTAEEQSGFPNAAEVAFYPLTFPILVEPGTITTPILYRQQASTADDLMAYAAIFVAVVCLVGFVFAMSAKLEGYLPQTGRVIMTRLMGMILTAIAVEMITSGLVVLLPGLAKAAA